MNLTNLNKQKEAGRYSFPMKLMATLVLLFSLFQSASAQAPFTLATGAPTNVSAGEVQFDLILTQVNTVNTYKFSTATIRGTMSNAATLLGSNGGTVSWGIVPGTIPSSWPVNVAPWPNALASSFGYTVGTGAFTISTSPTYFSSTTAPLLTASTPLVIGRMFVKVTGGTGEFAQNAPLGFTWNVGATGAGITAYVNAATTATGFQNNTTGCTKSSTATNGWLLNVPSNTCPTAVAASNVVDPTCFGGTGSADFTLTPAPLPLGGTYTVDGGAGVAYTSNPFSITGLSQGTHTIAVTNGTCGVVSTTVTIGGPSSAPTTTENETHCNTYTWNTLNGDGNTYTTSGTYTYAHLIGGCPGVSTLNLTINTPDNHVDNPPAQCGGSYTWTTGDGNTYNTSGTYTYATNANGCPGVATLNLTINQPDNHVDNPPAQCGGSYTWTTGDGNTYNTSGTYTYATNANGCPGVATLNLTINQPDNHVDNPPAQCGGSYTWTTGDGNTYSASGTYTYATNANGCPGVATLNLVINTPSNPVTNGSGCSSYMWAENGQTYYASGTYTAATNVNGCPGVATLNLTLTGGHMVLATAGNAASTVGSATATGTLANNAVTFEVACDYAVMINDGPAGVGAGATTVTVDVAAGNYTNTFGTNGQIYAPRKFTISATNNEAAGITLYATQDDFNDYNAANGSLFAMNAGTVKVAQAVGGLSGVVTNLATTAVWNAGANRYEITAEATEMNGEYYLYTDPQCSLSMGPISVSAQTQNSTTLTWAAVPGAISYDLRYRVQGSTTWQPTSSSTTSKTINTGLYNTVYEVQGKVRCSATTSGLWSTTVTTFTTAAAPCQPATNLAAIATPNTINVTWTAANLAQVYTMQWRPVTTNPSAFQAAGQISGTSYVINQYGSLPLTSGTQYEVRIKTECVGGASSAWSTSVFTTTLANPCVAPTNLAAVATATGANVTWDVAPGAISYFARIRKSAVGVTPAGPWNNAGCPTNSRYFSGLTPNTSYDVEVRSNCAGNLNSAMSSYTFTTGVSLRPTTEPTSLTEISEAFNVYPNPTTDVVNVELTAYQAQTTTVKVYDLTGRLMKQVVSQTEAGSQKIEVSLGEIASGVYTVQVYENDKMTHITRVRKN